MFALSLVLKEASLSCPDPERAAVLERAEFLFKLGHKHQNFPLWLAAFSWEKGHLSLAFPIIFFQTNSCWFHHRREMSAATPGLCEPLFKEQSCLLSHPAHPLCCLCSWNQGWARAIPQISSLAAVALPPPASVGCPNQAVHGLNLGLF